MVRWVAVAMSRRKYQGVKAYIGMPGSGKTYALAQEGQQALARGEKVYCNAGFDLQGATVFESFDDFALITDGLILFDEMPLYFAARKWQDFPDGMLYKFTQIRKDNIRLSYSSIHEGLIDVNIRRVTFWYWHCHAVMGRLLVRRLYVPVEFRKSSARPIATEWAWVRDSVAATYDTLAKVKVPQAASAKIIKRMDSGAWRVPAPATAPAVPEPKLRDLFPENEGAA